MQMYIKYLCISESFYNDANLLHMPVRGLWRLVHVAPSGETHVAPSGETHAAPSGETHVAPSGERHERRVRRPSPIAHAALSGGRARLPPAVGTGGAPWRADSRRPLAAGGSQRLRRRVARPVRLDQLVQAAGGRLPLLEAGVVLQEDDERAVERPHVQLAPATQSQRCNQGRYKKHEIKFKNILGGEDFAL